MVVFDAASAKAGRFGARPPWRQCGTKRFREAAQVRAGIPPEHPWQTV